MTGFGIPYPPEVVRIGPGDYLLEATAPGQIRVYMVRDLVSLRRLVPFADDQLIDQEQALDSEVPAYTDEVFCLLTAFRECFASTDQAIRAVDGLEVHSDDMARCINLEHLTPDLFVAHRSPEREH